jgi:hypothetical protein
MHFSETIQALVTHVCQSTQEGEEEEKHGSGSGTLTHNGPPPFQIDGHRSFVFETHIT